jgi:hypothetical protein
MTTKEETVRLVELLWATWPNNDASSAAKKVHYEAWHRIICDLPYKFCIKALDEFVIEDKPWAPRPGAMRKRAIDLMDPNGTAPIPIEAWGQFQRNLASATSGSDFVPLHPLVSRAVEKLGATTQRGLHTNGDRDLFIKVYEEVLRVSEQERYGIKE